VVEVIFTTTAPQAGTLATLTGVLTLLLGATAVFGELAAVLNLIWEVQPKPFSGVGSALGDWLKQRVFSLAIVLAIAFLRLVSLVISAALAGAAT
jgi:membrane protein